MSATSTTPARGVQLIDRAQWRAIVGVALLALAACVHAGVALHNPTAPACPVCVACPACPQSPERHHR